MPTLIPPCDNPDPIFTSLTFLARDYSSIVERGIDRIPKLTKDWSDFTITDPGILYLSGLGWIFDTQNYRLDKKYFNNTFRYTRNLNALLNMADMMGVHAGSNDSAVSFLQLYLFNTTRSIMLPKGFQFRILNKSDNTYYYYNLVDSTFLVPGKIDNIGIVVEGTPQYFELDIEWMQPDNSLIFYFNDVAYNGFEISSDFYNGYFNLVDDALMVKDNIPSYSLTRYRDNYVKIQFSPGIRNYVNESIHVEYLLTNGTRGSLTTSASNVEVVGNLDELVDDDSHPLLQIAVLETRSGVDLFTVPELKTEISQKNNATFTLVTNKDYSNIASKTQNIYHIASFQDGLSVTLYYVAESNFNEEDAKNEILDAIGDNLIAFTNITIYPIEVLEVDMVLTVYLQRNYQNLDELRDTIVDYIRNSYSRKDQIPGTFFSQIQLATDISDLNKIISYTVIEEPSNDIIIRESEILEIGNITVNFLKEGRT